MAGFFKKGSDGLLNGAILGGLLGVGIIFGEKVVEFVTTKLPAKMVILDMVPETAAKVYIVAAALVLGYIFDRV
jgi:hypothetical protein